MAKLFVKDFSCLTQVEIEVNRINIIIGPQGTGKSVTIKILYFFIDILENCIQQIEDGVNFSDYKRTLEQSFIRTFPPTAWGSKRFNISYTSGAFSIRILRKQKKAGSRTEEVNFAFSDWFQKMYVRSLEYHDSLIKKTALERTTEEIDETRFEDPSYRLRRFVRKLYQDELGLEYTSGQTFIPAGRAFFTSIGRLIAGFEHSGSLDPVTLRFARLLAGWKDQSTLYYRYERDVEVETLKSTLMMQLFGGRISTKREADYLETPDGRRIPFGALSSGQQELIPIWYFLNSLIGNDYQLEKRRVATTLRRTIYIEEPEAHLFPSAQALLVKALIEVVATQRSHRQLFITTHSPYVMTQLNVLLKAAQVGRNRRRAASVAEVVPRNLWINREDINAWKIEDGRLISIIDESDGLIDANYLDSVSGSSADDFDRLLSIEYPS